MTSLVEMMREGGIFAYLVLATGLSAIGLAIAAVVFNLLPLKRKKRLALITIGLLTLVAAAVAIALGTIGYIAGLSELWNAVGTAPVEHRQAMMARGIELAKIPIQFAIILNAVPLVVGVVTIVRGLRAPKADIANVFD